MNKIFQKEIDAFREKVLPICPVCLKKGVNTYGECKCSYETSPLRSVREVESFLLSALRRASMSVVEAKIKEIEAIEILNYNDYIVDGKKSMKEDCLGILKKDTLATAREITGGK